MPIHHTVNLHTFTFISLQDWFCKGVGVNIIVLCALVASALWTVMTRSLIRSAIGLALTSAMLTVIMFRFDSSLAAVFELSVCAGLISVVFISTISLTQPLTTEEVLEHMRRRLQRFGYLPILILAAGVGLSLIKIKFQLQLPIPETQADVRNVMWNIRQLDLLAQMLMIIAGVFGVMVLFREMRRK